MSTPSTVHLSNQRELRASDLQNWRLLPWSIELGSDLAAKLYLDEFEKKVGNRVFIQENTSDPWILAVQPLEWDSKFFSLKTAKIDIIPPAQPGHNAESLSSGITNLNGIFSQLRADGFKLLTAQVDTRDSLIFQSLEKNGFLMVDTIFGYQLAVRSFQENSQIRHATRQDEVVLRKIAAECFDNREQNVNRFNSDVRIQACTRKMYELWIAKSLSGERADAVLVFEDNEKVVGFITIKKEPGSYGGKSFASISLNAVSPGYQGKGIYNVLVKSAINWANEQNIDVVQIKTQISNCAVHSCWSRLGASIFTTYHTFHGGF